MKGRVLKESLITKDILNVGRKMIAVCVRIAVGKVSSLARLIKVMNKTQSIGIFLL